MKSSLVELIGINNQEVEKYLINYIILNNL